MLYTYIQQNYITVDFYSTCALSFITIFVLSNSQISRYNKQDIYTHKIFEKRLSGLLPILWQKLQIHCQTILQILEIVFDCQARTDMQEK